MIAERGEHGVGDGADPGLQRRSVLDERCGDPADLELRFARLDRWHFEQGAIDLHRMMNLADMDQRIAVHARHAPIDLRDHNARRLHRRRREAASSAI